MTGMRTGWSAVCAWRSDRRGDGYRMKGTVKMFAYGSNLARDRLHARVPSARFVGRARLDGYSLLFHKRGADGSAKANAFHTGLAGDCVWGAVFECSADEQAALDRIEQGYGTELVRVELDHGGMETAWIYVADPSTIDESLKPFTWYRNYVLTGAGEQGLPAEHIEKLQAQPAVRDPDPEREARNTRSGA